MYRVGICDDDKVLCSLLEEQIQGLSADISVKFEIEVWYSGESLERDLKKGVGLDLLFLDIELLQKNGIEIGAFIRDEMEDTDTHIVYISSKQGYAMELFKMQPLEFLVKPISVARLKEVLERSMKRKKCTMCYKIGYELPMILIVSILHTALLKKVLDTFLPTEDKNRLIWKIVFVGYYLFTTAAYRVFHVSLFYEMCNLAGIIGVACFYRGTWEKKIWISIVYFCMDIGNGVAVSFASSEMIRMQQSAISALLLLICVMVVCHIPDPKESREKELDRKQMFLLSAIPTLSVMVFWGLMYGSIGRLTAVFVCVVVLILNLCVFYLYHFLLKNYVQLREQDIYKQQTIAYQNQFELMKESQSRIRALRHDMKNHVLALEGLAKGSEPEKLIAYLDSMQEFMQNPSEHIYTGNEALDSLLNFKLQRAKEELKKVETDIVLPEKMNLQSFDFNVIVGNLLDNAIAVSIQTDKQFLKLNMRIGNGVLFLYMVNSCMGIPDGACEIRRLSEKSFTGHGIGLTNVQRIVEKYHGDMEMHCKNNYMETEIVLYMKNL